MSLDYDYIFSQIDKAKKKRKRWTQADTDAAYKKMQEDKKDKQPAISQRMYKKPEDRKPGEKPGTYTNIGQGIGRNRGFGHVSEATNRKTRDRKGLSGVPRKQQIENKKRKEQEVYDKIQALNENIATGLPTLQEIEVSEARTLAEAEQAKRERKIARGGKKIGIDAPKITPPKKKKKKVKPKVESKKPVIHTEELQDESEVDVIADSDDEDTDVGPITKDAELLKGKMRKLMDTITGKKIQSGESAEGYKTFGPDPKKEEKKDPFKDVFEGLVEPEKREEKKKDPFKDVSEVFGKSLWKSFLNKKKDDDEYNNVMNDITSQRKGSTYDKGTKTYINPLGVPSTRHCGATSRALEDRGYGKRVEGTYHGGWDKKGEDHSWVENKDGHIIDASRDQYHGPNEKGIKTIKQDNPDYANYKKRTCPGCGTDTPPKRFTNMITQCKGEGCGHVEDEAPKMFKRHYGREHKGAKELGEFRKEITPLASKLHGIKRSLKSWLKEKMFPVQMLKEPHKKWQKEQDDDEQVEASASDANKASEGSMEEILAERRSVNAHRAGNTPKKFAADRFRDYLLADIESQEENQPLKMTEAQLEEKKRKKTHHDRTLINTKRRKTGYNIRSRRKAEERTCKHCGGKGRRTDSWSDPKKVFRTECTRCGGTGTEHSNSKFMGENVWEAPEKKKAEEGVGGMLMGAQRGLGHEAGYKQDPGQSAQITEVKDKIDKIKKGVGKKREFTNWRYILPTTSGKKKEKPKKTYKKPEKKMTAAELEREKFKKDPDPEVQANYERNLEEMGKKKPDAHKSAYENHEQDESPETKPNKQQIPASKPGTDIFKSLYKKALIIKYKNIYKPLNT